MNTASTLIADQRRSAQKRLSTVVSLCVVGVLLACYIVASNADYAEAAAREQHTADIACRVAGANHAVRIDADGSSIFICDRPMGDKPIRRAILQRDAS